MKTSHVLKIAALILPGLMSTRGFAGGGGAGPVISYETLVTCQSQNAQDTHLHTVKYFLRHESQWGATHTKAGIYLEGDEIEATVYNRNNGNIHQITRPQDQAEVVHGSKSTISVINSDNEKVEAFEIQVNGNSAEVKVSTTAVQNAVVSMTCSRR